MSFHPPPPPADDVPPGGGRPGLRQRISRVAIDTSPLRDFPSFRRLWIGQTISFLGSEINQVAVPIQLYRLTHSTLQLGLIEFTILVPLLSVTLVGGAIADAVDRRRLVLWTESGLALVAGGFLVNAALPHPRVWALYVLSAAGATVFTLGVSASRTIVPYLVPEEKFAAASALENLYSSFGAVLGPALAGALVAAIGFDGVYGLDVASFAASLWSIAALPAIAPAPDADRPSVRSIVEGFRFLRRQPVVLGFFLVDTNAMVFGMPSALFPALAAHRFHGGATVTGLLYSAPSAGALIGSLSSGWVARVRRQGLAVAVSAALWGASIAVFGLMQALWLALLFLALAGAADFVSATFRGVMLLAATPRALLGRLTGIEFAQVASAPTLGNVEAGVLASFTSLRFSVVSGGIATMVGTLLVSLAFPALIRYDARAKRE